MARTNLPITACHFNAGFVTPAGTTIDQANGMVVSGTSLEGEGVPATGGQGRLLLQVANTAAGAHNIILRAGVNPPAMRAALGDLKVSVTNGTTFIVGPLESGRFAQTDGSLSVDFDVGFTGTINAYLIDRALVQ